MKYLFVLIILMIGINCSSSKYSFPPVGHFVWDNELIDSVSTYTEVMPSFPGGDDGFYRFISGEIRYPLLAKSAGVEGKVYIQFVITRYGDVALAKVVKGIGYGCDDEALRVVNLMPRWNPGKQNGKPVNVRISVPIVYYLN